MSKKHRHGMRYHPMYGRWLGMRQRCNDKNHTAYWRYGGAGVYVCERWADFSLFVEDMGEPPFPGASIDRIDGKGPYAPWNCRWADHKTQTRNKSSNLKYTHGGETLCLSDWAARLGLTFGSMKERIDKWPIEKALSVKKLPNKGRKKDGYATTV